ncbi:hypothetical protein GGD81_002836 [Rhodobium orientis]|uniref:Uncharacterized protein n=1 Tax=Rhodobium gokarnense TaxID=364296 RepID=A0ABT3HBY9_9HYPH|nr:MULTISPECIES: hypothetical protein [Rhodobium]MBB4303784.1 hypothetical protein [Rhodobium orientis]MCW2307910.1 hypothetical protein [Rhodobium gokarnense]
MGTILQFVASPQYRHRPPRTVPGESGSVLIFPGVRIERWEKKTSAPCRKCAAKPKTDADPATWR